MSSDRFVAQVTTLESLLRGWRDDGTLLSLPPPARPWPRGRRLVLGADAALDLGNPASGSCSFMLWEHGEAGSGHEVMLLGPDIPELVAEGVRDRPLGLVILARGPFRDEYDDYLDLKEALYSIALDGLTLRSMPSHGHLWMRLHREAAEQGFSFAHLGAALVRDLSAICGVEQLSILFVTVDGEPLAALESLSEEVQRRVFALIKRNEEEYAECDECEYQDFCDEREHMA